MRKIKQVLRLHYEHHSSKREIAKSLGISRNAITEYLMRFSASTLTWPLPCGLGDLQLEQHLYPNDMTGQFTRKTLPDWAQMHAAMKQKGATLQILHEEYLAQNQGGLSYSRFCTHYRIYKKSLKRFMRQIYAPGEKVFVDYAGPTFPIYERGKVDPKYAQIFVGVLGASNYIYAQANWSQKLEDWIDAHVRMFAHFGGVPSIIVCDNLKSAVTKVSRTEPIINATYQALAEHYGALVIPARAYKPKDKAKAENGVLIVERWILFRLRQRVFTSLTDLNAGIQELLSEINGKPFQKIAGTRRSLFESLDYPALKPLPDQQYEFAQFFKARVGMDYCVTVDGCAYSVPWQLAGKEVELRISIGTIEVLHTGERVASHAKSHGQTMVIKPEHMEEAHRRFGSWNATSALTWAQTIGGSVAQLLQRLLEKTRGHEQGYRLNTIFKKLAEDYGGQRMELACARALEIDAYAISSLRSILRLGLDGQPNSNNEIQEANLDHPNVRGSTYYH